MKAAKKNLIRRAVVVLVAYEAVFLATMFWVDRTRPEGVDVVCCGALLPTVTVVDEVLRSISGAGALPSVHELGDVLPGVWCGSGGADDA